MMSKKKMQQLIFFIALLACFTPWIDPPLALLLGFILAQTTGHPFITYNHTATNWLLKLSVIGLGFGMNLHHAIEAGKTGLLFTIASISITLVAGFFVGKYLNVDRKTSFLISSGTAICGGSAIAAVSPLIHANEKQMSVALGTIFILNSIALLIFPAIGHWLAMTEQQFGTWCAIAIHDTSSVVGAAAKYGQISLQIATTIKLERALWIVPLSLGTAFFAKSEKKNITIPYFIAFFVVAMGLSTYLPAFKAEYDILIAIAKRGLTVTLFLIGAGLSFSTIKSVGIRPLAQGIGLWLLISVLSAFVILNV